MSQELKWLSKVLAGVETPAHPPSPPLFLLPSLELLGFPTRFWHKSLTKSLQTFQETLPRLLPRWLWMWKGSLCALCFIQHTYFIAAMLMSLCIWICKKKTMQEKGQRTDSTWWWDKPLIKWSHLDRKCELVWMFETVLMRSRDMGTTDCSD